LKQDIKDLSVLASYIGASPGSGAYEFRISAPLSASMVQVELKKSNSARLHDIVWRRTLELIRSLSSATSLTSDEARIFGAVTKSVNKLGATWPSELRNSINYTPGCGYTTVRRQTQIPQFGFVQVDPSVPMNNAIGRLETSVASIEKGGLLANLQTANRIMVDLVLVLDAMARALYEEIVQRRNIDRRWLNARNRFFSDQFKVFNNSDWPYAA